MKNLLLIMLISIILMSLSLLLSKKSFLDKEKSSPFECGFDPYLLTRTPFSLRFFKIAIIFLIFDIEIILVLPLPLINNMTNYLFMISSFFILMIILLGLLFEWHQGMLNWMK